MKLIQSFKESGLLIKGISETTKNEAKEQKGRLLSVLLGTLGVGLLGNLLTDKDTTGVSEGTIRITSSLNKIWNTKVLSKWT